MSGKNQCALLEDSGDNSVIFTVVSRSYAFYFVKLTRKNKAVNFFVALCRTDRYNNKTRLAEAAPKGGFAPDALPLDGGECPMLTTSVLNSILGLDIILVLVLVVLVPKRIVRLVMRETGA